MRMTVKNAIKDCFRQLIVILPYNNISVSLICRETSISRASFYDYFSDKEAIISSIVNDNLITPQIVLLETIPLSQFKSRSQISMELLFGNIRDDAEFYTRINRVESGGLLVRTLTRGFQTIISDVFCDLKLQDDEEHYAALLFANSTAVLISEWLCRGMDIYPAQLAQLHNKLTMHWWQDVMGDKLAWLKR
jgi:AcrR family transcriptional regulator